MLSQSINQTTQSVSSTSKTALYGIDLFKFVCAILVFIIHCPPFVDGVSDFTNKINFILQHILCRISVPFYFVCSGFFLFKKMSLYDINIDIIKGYCFKLLRLLGLWSLLLFWGSTVHLWYLSATIVAIVLLSLCLHFRLKLRFIWLGACLLYAIGLLGDSYHGLVVPLLENPVINILYSAYIRLFGTTRNGVFMGFIFILLGASLSQVKMNMRPLRAVIGLLISIVGLFFEACFLEYHSIPIQYNMYVFLIPASYFLFCLAYTLPLKNRSIYRQLRSIGMLFYYIHLFVLGVCYILLRRFGNHVTFGILNPQFVLSLSAALLIVVCLEWLSRKEKFTWLNWLLA